MHLAEMPRDNVDLRTLPCPRYGHHHDHLLITASYAGPARTKGFVVGESSRGHDGQQCWALNWLASQSEIEQVPVTLLRRGDSPRSKGESKTHTESMVEAAEMPPIIVRRETLQVIDGMHRLKAAALRQEDTIAVRFFDGTPAEAFVLAVVANINHGLPLNTTDRKAAAARILQMYPAWSDRAVAAASGLSHHTVAVVRRSNSTGQIAQLNRRTGRDGKARPLASNEGREAAAALIRSDPDKTAREVARRAGVSVGTVHDVRSRLRQGIGPTVSKCPATNLNVHLARGQAVLARLRNNPAVRFNDGGKAILELLSRSLQVASDAQSMSRNAPEHCRETLAELAAALSDAWSRLAKDLRTGSQAS